MRLVPWLLALVAVGCGADIRVNSNAGGDDGANAVPGQSQVCTVELAVEVEDEDWTEVGLSVPYDRSIGQFALPGYEVECEARAGALRLYASDESDASDPSRRRLVVFADGGGGPRKDTPEITCRLFAPVTPPVDAFPGAMPCTCPSAAAGMRPRVAQRCRCHAAGRWVRKISTNCSRPHQKVPRVHRDARVGRRASVISARRPRGSRSISS